jgi:hypothetical protein
MQLVREIRGILGQLWMAWLIDGAMCAVDRHNESVIREIRVARHPVIRPNNLACNCEFNA